MRTTRILLCLCAVVSFVAPQTSQPVRVAAQTAAPAQAATTVKLDGLKASVTVRRDERGIPYIEAANLDDLYFAQGYVVASDRLWQMDLLRRTARGELSEIFGRAALEEDKRHRTYGFTRVAEAMVARALPRARAAIEAYTRGVNAYIDSLDEKSLPAEFQILRYRPRHWTPADSYAVGKNFSDTLSTTWRLDVMRGAFADLPAARQAEMFPSRSPNDVLVVGSDRKPGGKQAPRRRAEVLPGVDAPNSVRDLSQRLALLRALGEDAELERRSRERVGLYAEDLAASNNWVVSGKRTVTGKPLLANDPHLAASAPSIWYMIHLSAPGMRVAGVTSPGAPGVLIGHNERIAWGVTNLAPDVQDVYRERFESENSRRYMTPSGLRDAEVRREEIKVRKSPQDTATESVMHEVITTRHGPIVLERGGERYALRWTALNPDETEFEGFLFLNTARNWDEFREALRHYTGPTQNFIYADTDGHIGYYGAGRIPLRKSGDGSLPYDGSTDAGEWTGFIPFAELPHVYDPPSGIIVTANSRVVGDTYPHHLTNAWAAPWRTRRIYDLLTARNRKLSAEDFREAQADVYTLSGVAFSKEVRDIAVRGRLAQRDPKWNDTLAALARWNGRLEAESNPPLILGEMRAAFLRKVVEGAAGAERAKEYRWPSSSDFVDRLIKERPAEWLPAGMKSYADLLDDAHREARAELAKKYGPDESKWTWEATQLARFQHPLAGVPFVGTQFLVAPFPARGSGGQFATPNVGSGVSMRLIADTADWDRTRQGIALGESGNPRSPHWKDQLADWRDAQTRVFPFTQRAVETSARATTVLAPK